MQKWLASIKKFSAWIVENLDWVMGIVLSFSVGLLGIIGWSPPNIIFAVTLLVLGLLSTGALRDRNSTQHFKNLLNEFETNFSTLSQINELVSDRRSTGINRVIAQTFNFNWVPYIKESNHIIIVKLRHDYSDDLSYYEAFETVLDKGGSVTLVLSDPRAPATWLRYKEEPSSLLTSRRPGEVTWVSGLEDLARVLYQLHSWKQHLRNEGRDVSRLSLRLISNYPGLAYYKFDTRILFHSYPYCKRGFYAPAFMFTDNTTSVHQFLCRCIQSIIDSSLPLEDVIDDIWKKYNARLFSDEQVRISQLAIVPKNISIER